MSNIPKFEDLDFSKISTKDLTTALDYAQKNPEEGYSCYTIECENCPFFTLNNCKCPPNKTLEYFTKEYNRRPQLEVANCKVNNTSEDFVHNNLGGVKETSVNGEFKPMYQLIEPDFVEGIAKVLTMGAKKYSPDNWKKVDENEYIRALMSHYIKWRNGEKIDVESGLSHIYHLAVNAMFLSWFDSQRPVGEKEDSDKTYLKG